MGEAFREEALPGPAVGSQAPLGWRVDQKCWGKGTACLSINQLSKDISTRVHTHTHVLGRPHPIHVLVTVLPIPAPR